SAPCRVVVGLRPDETLYPLAIFLRGQLVSTVSPGCSRLHTTRCECHLDRIRSSPVTGWSPSIGLRPARKAAATPRGNNRRLADRRADEACWLGCQSSLGSARPCLVHRF